MITQSFVLSPLPPTIKIVTFGVKYKQPKPDADWSWDCRCLDNPPGDLWSFNGLSKPIQTDIMRQISSNKRLFKWFQGILNTAIGWAQLSTRRNTNGTLAFYCYGGRHRSVATAELVNRYLFNKGFVSSVDHLDVANVDAFLKGHKK